jgi:hypothetical protein
MAIRLLINSLTHLRMKATLLLVLLGTSITLNVYSTTDLNRLLKDLDAEITMDEKYVVIKETNIANLKNNKSKRNVSKADLYSLNKSLFNEYKTYISDSAIYYLNQNLDISQSLRDPYRINETHLLSAFFLMSVGLYPEGLDALNHVDRAYMDKTQKIEYYRTFKGIYAGIAQYTQDSRRKAKYWVMSNLFIDSLRSILSKDSPIYLSIEENREREHGNLQQALLINDKCLKLTQMGTEEYALYMFYRALIYRKMNDTERQKESLILSAISDIQCGIKDNASISMLANILFEEGDLDRAYNYIRFSLNNGHIFGSRIRSSQVLKTLTIIDKTYHEKNEKKNKELRIYFILICTLSVILSILSFLVYKQMRKQVNSNQYIIKTNKDLEDLNGKLKEANTMLGKTNLKVKEANRIQEEYIGYFLNLCVQYVDKINNYRKMVNKKIKEKQIEELYSITNSQTLKEEELKELFANFDNIFLHLFPNFIESFNKLLADDEQIVLREGELLTTELRIYALIRLGINDSTKIANALGYSLSTVYNYRTKMKNKAKPPREDFERLVKRIDAFKK